MLMVCHHLNPSVPEDLAFAESRIRPSTIAAEDVLHDMGAISIIGSDAQAMGRVGEVILRTWQTAHVMKRRRGSLPGDGAADNHRARRYVAKYTICPAVAHGLDHEIGSVAVGKLADLVLWDPRFFGVRPHVVVKGGMIAWAQMGDANASIPTPAAGARPTDVRRGAPRRRSDEPDVRGATPRSTTGWPIGWRCRGRLVASRDTRSTGKADLPRERRAAVDHRRTPTRSPCASTASSSTSSRSSELPDGAAVLPLLMSAHRRPAPARRQSLPDRRARAQRRRGGERGARRRARRRRPRSRSSTAAC